jgi:hypothetical protein
LVLIPLELNGVLMRFLLDTGVAETILFSLADKSEVMLQNVEKIKMRGLGDQDAVEGLKSRGNVLKTGGLVKTNEVVIVVLDESFNFSASLGIEVNGIIGSSFFENNIVEINFLKKKITIHKDLKTVRKLHKYEAFELNIEGQKPYMNVDIVSNNQQKNLKLLLDTGNSDGLWIFRTPQNKLKIPEKSFEDFLGRGFSGDIYGKRATISKLNLKNFDFSKVVCAFPDTLSVQKMNLVSDRSGSIGGEIFSRFHVVFDYAKNKLYLKKNHRFYAHFPYNKSGIELQHAGSRLIKEEIVSRALERTEGGVRINFGGDDKDIKFKFELKPNFEVVSIRKGSPAQNSGLQVGDLIISINGVSSYRYKLQQINDILRTEEDNVIKMNVERHGVIINIQFKLFDVL